MQALLGDTQETTPEVGSEVSLADEGVVPGTSLSVGYTTSETFSFAVPDAMPAENMETEQIYETGPTSSLSSTMPVMMPEENVITEEQNCGDNDFFTSGTQWLAADTGDTQLLKDHTYCRVPPLESTG